MCTAGPERCWWTLPGYATRNEWPAACPSAPPQARQTDVQYLLSRACRPILVRLSKERTLCAFDFDGTLAPIVPHPNQAGLRDRTRHLLASLAAAYPCV